MERTTLSTVLQVLTLIISLIGAIGVLIINSKVDRLTGQVQTLQDPLVTHRTTFREQIGTPLVRAATARNVNH